MRPSKPGSAGTGLFGPNPFRSPTGDCGGCWPLERISPEAVRTGGSANETKKDENHR